MSRLIDVGSALASFCAPYVDSAELSFEAEARLGDLDGLTKAVIVPTNTEREMGRGCTHYVYTFEIGIARWMKEGEKPETYVALAEQMADALMGEDLDIGVAVQSVTTDICDTGLVKKRRQFLCVLTVEVMDGGMGVWNGRS